MDLRKMLARVGHGEGIWRTLPQPVGRDRTSRSRPFTSPLHEVRGFGSNPGNLRMFGYLPPTLAENPGLVVVLHGCTQSAAGYDFGAGWSTLAKRFGFAVLLPEQQRSNNANGCFNWFQPVDIQRDSGEALSIRQMIERYATDHGIDRRRIYITGLSAGGAMTSVMLACYPEVFAGGAIVAGLPYGAAANVKQAFQSMFQCPVRPAREWADTVRAASSHQGPWPRVSVWHGNADTTVIPSNARETLKQWTELHGLRQVPSARTIVDGYPREVWCDANGNELIEFYTITNMAHGTPLATGDGDSACGAPGPFLLSVGISSSYHIAKFFGLSGPALRRNSPAEAAPIHDVSMDNGADEGPVLEGEILGKEDFQRQEPMPHGSFEIGAAINKALAAAGLIKR